MIEHDEVFRIRTERLPGTLARVLTMIGEHGATIGDIETVAVQHDHNVRDVTVIAPSADAVSAIERAISATEGAELVDHVDKVFAKHEGGKLTIVPTVGIETLQDVREIYTPGVARVSSAIADDPTLADRYTWRGRTVAIVTDGSRVLGLGNIGPKAALPVMEGKAMFYSMLVGINAVPIVLDTDHPDEIIETVVRIAPGFGAIHLEDIANPGVYHIEDELDRLLPMPVMHDDQHGTATVVLGAVIAAAHRLGRPLEEMVFGQIGLGAAGSAIAALASRFPFKRVLGFNRSEGGRDRLKSQIEPERLDDVDADADMEQVIAESDVLVLAVAQPDFLKSEQVRRDSVVFAISNPVPEITMADAIAGGAAISADGTIVNNVLAYPGLFRGALDAGATAITPGMRTAAAVALAGMAPDGGLLPHPLDRDVHSAVAAAVAAASGG
jgi:malate dehydrogenase (oxaloacetate-decarboxylating)